MNLLGLTITRKKAQTLPDVAAPAPITALVRIAPEPEYRPEKVAPCECG